MSAHVHVHVHVDLRTCTCDRDVHVVVDVMMCLVIESVHLLCSEGVVLVLSELRLHLDRAARDAHCCTPSASLSTRGECGGKGEGECCVFLAVFHDIVCYSVLCLQL